MVRLSLLLFLLFEEIIMTRGVLKLRQIEESANDIYMQQRLVVVARVAKLVRLMQVVAHRCDRRLDVLMAANAFGNRAWLAPWLKSKSGPIILGLFNFRAAVRIGSSDPRRDHECSTIQSSHFLFLVARTQSEFSLWKAQKLKHCKVLRASLFDKHDWADGIDVGFRIDSAMLHAPFQ